MSGDQQHSRDDQDVAPDTSEPPSPSLYFVPCLPPEPGDQEIRFTLKPLEDGRLALLAYQSVGLLVGCCGQRQPWVALPESEMENAFRSSGADVVALNLMIPKQLRSDADPDVQDIADYHGSDPDPQQPAATAGKAHGERDSAHEEARHD